MKTKDSGEESLRISKDWRVFAVKLSGVLSEMIEDQILVISEKHRSRFVQFAAQGNWGLRAEITSNAYLSRSDRLTRVQTAQLVKAGWGAPTGKPGKSTPENDPDGSPNFFIDFPAPLKTVRIATQAVAALSEILRIPHPGHLEYEGFDTDGNAFALPQLGIKRKEKEERADPTRIAKQLLSALREITGIKSLDFDADRDISLRYGSVTMFVRVIDNPPLIRFYAPLVRDVCETHKLHARLNGLNSDIGFMHFFVRDRIIYGISEINALPLQYVTLEKSMRMFSAVADGIDDALEAEFGGKAMTAGEMRSAMIH